MKTISMFLRASKTEAEEAGIETEGMAESVSKLRDEILKLSKVDIMLDDENYKSTYQILQGLSKVWDDISDVSQANILEKLGGKRNANVVASIINNFDVAEQALQTSLNSAGSAIKENEKYLNSIEGHINKLTIAYEGLSQTIISSDLVKSGADFLTSTVNSLNGIVKTFGALPTTIGAATAALSAFKDAGIIKRSDVKGIWDLLITKDSSQSLIGTTSRKGTKGLSNISSIIKEFNTLTDADKQKEFADSIAKTNSNLGAYLNSVQAGGASTKQYAKFLATSTLETVGLTAATAALNAAISLGASFLISMFISAIDDAIHANENFAKSFEDCAENIKTTSDDLKSLRQQLSDNVNKIRELEKIGNLTLFQKDTYEELKKQNEELTTQLKLKENELKVLQQEQAITAKNATKELTQGNDFINAVRVISKIPFIGGLIGFIAEPTGIFTPQFEKDKDALASYEDYYRRLQEWEKERSKWLAEYGDNPDVEMPDYYDKYISDLNSKISEVEVDLQAKRNQFEQYLLLLDPDDPANKEAIAEYESYIERFDAIFNKTHGIGDKFTSIYESADFVNITQSLETLAKEGKLTEETFDNVSGIETFKEALASIGITDVQEIIDAIIERVKESGTVAEGAAGAFDTYAERLSRLKETTEGWISQRSAVQDIYDKVSIGEALTDDDILKLESYPELLGKVTATTDGWTISVEDLAASYKDLSINIRDAYAAERDSLIAGIQSRQDQYNKNQFKTVNNPEEAEKLTKKQKELKDQMADGEAQVAALDAILKIYNSTLKESNQETAEFADILKQFSSNISTGTSAQKEMNETGSLSANTLSSLITLGEEYNKCITIENGLIKFNAETYKELEKAKLDDEIATIKLTEAELIYQRNQAAMYGNASRANELNQLLADSFIKRNALQHYKDTLDEIWNEALSGSIDEVKSQFDTYMHDYELAHERGLISDADYYAALNYANETYYKNSIKHLEDYEANVTKIYNAGKEAYKKKCDDELEILDEQLKQGYLTQKQYDEKVADLANRYYGTTSPYYGQEWNTTNYKELIKKTTDNDQDQYKEDFEKARKNIDEQFEKGILSVSEYRNELYNLREEWWGETSRWYGTTFASDMWDELTKELKDRTDEYEEWLEDIKQANDGSIEDMESYAKTWRTLILAAFGSGQNPKKEEEELLKVVDYEKSILDKMYEDGYISAKEYFNKVIKLWQDNKGIMGQDTLGEWMQDALDKRAEQEKTYWENQKSLVEEYYDAQIEALEKVEDEEEKIKKAEELRLNLIKARQALEDAKSQRNVLIFENGAYRYDVNQDDVLSAEEAYLEALEAIRDNELQEQITLLKEQKDETTKIYDAIIGMISAYISKTYTPTESDAEMLGLMANSEWTQDYLNGLTNKPTANELTEAQKALASGDWTSYFRMLKDNPLFAMNIVEKLTRQSGNLPENKANTATAQNAVDNAMSNVYNNSTITDDHSTHVGDIHVTVQGGTSQEMITEFTHKLSSAISAAIPKATN